MIWLHKRRRWFMRVPKDYYCQVSDLNHRWHITSYRGDFGSDTGADMNLECKDCNKQAYVIEVSKQDQSDFSRSQLGLTGFNSITISRSKV